MGKMLDEALKRSLDDVPQLSRGRVWCKVCGRTMKINSGLCMENGWPKCCTYTMTIDSPDERAFRAALRS